MAKASNTAAPEAANIMNFSSGHRSWGPLTITWYMDNSLPTIEIVVLLENKLIGIGRLDGASDIHPISYSFSGAAGTGLDSATAKGTLVLDTAKKEVTFDITVYFLVMMHQKGVLFSY